MAIGRPSPAQGRRILIGIASAIVVVVWVTVFAVPQQRTLAEVSAQVRALRAQVAEARRGLAQLPAMETEVASLVGTHPLPADAPPPEEQVLELLKAITEAARTSRVNLLTVKPKGDLGQVAPGVTGYVELPIELMASGGYHEIGAFVDAVERLPSFLLRIQRFQIQADPQDMWHHHAALALQAYLASGGRQGR